MRTDFIYQKIKSVRIKRYLLYRTSLPLRGVARDNSIDIAQQLSALNITVKTIRRPQA